MPLSQFLINYRKRNNLTTVEMSKKLNMVRESYSRLESGRLKRTNPTTFKHIASGLGTEPYVIEMDALVCLSSKDEENNAYFYYLSSVNEICKVKEPVHYPKDSPVAFYNCAIIDLRKKEVEVVSTIQSVYDFILKHNPIIGLGAMLDIGKEDDKFQISTGYLFDDWLDRQKHINDKKVNKLSIIFDETIEWQKKAFDRIKNKRYYYGVHREIRIILVNPLDKTVTIHTLFHEMEDTSYDD